MSALLNSLSSDNLVLLCVIMGIVALFLAIAISIEIYNGNKRYQKLVIEREKEKEKFEQQQQELQKLNIKESADIKYVEENSELEKTKAKLELANLRERLQKEEEEKQKLMEMNIALVNMANDKEIETLDDDDDDNIHVIEENEEEKEEIKEEVKEEVKEEPQVEINQVIINETQEDPIKEETNIEYNTYNNSVETLNEADYDDEENAIISYEELKNSQNFGYTDDEMDKYVDEEDAIISIQELEKLYLESQKIEVPTEPEKVEFEMKRVEDLPEIADDVNFQNSEFISPVYGISKSEKDLILEQTANLEKLNEEIRKTNEFLKTLKDLKKNLE